MNNLMTVLISGVCWQKSSQSITALSKSVAHNSLLQYCCQGSRLYILPLDCESCAPLFLTLVAGATALFAWIVDCSVAGLALAYFVVKNDIANNSYICIVYS